VTNSTRRSAPPARIWGTSAFHAAITVPVHLPFGRFAVMSAIVDRSCANWDEIRDHSRESLFRLMHIFTKAIHDLKLEDQIRDSRAAKLTARARSNAYAGRRPEKHRARFQSS